MADEDTAINDIDFDTEYDEDTAINNAAKQLENKYRIIGLNLYAEFPSGHRYKLPLNVDVTNFTGIDQNAEPAQQVHDLIESISPENAEQINQEPIINVIALSIKYAQTFEKVQAASLGKLNGSLTASKHTK